MNSKHPIGALVLAAAFGGVAWAQGPTDANLPAARAALPVTHLAIGTVRSVNASARSATIDHQAIPSLNMPAMTMPFRLPESLTPPLKIGQSIAFTFTASSDGLTIGSVQAIANMAAPSRDGPASAGSMPGMSQEGMHGKGGMKGMMDSCQTMMGSR